MRFVNVCPKKVSGNLRTSYAMSRINKPFKTLVGMFLGVKAADIRLIKIAILNRDGRSLPKLLPSVNTIV